jgi:hypothetical protein
MPEPTIIQRIKRKLDTVLIVTGMLILLAAWVSQQVLFERWSEQLDGIANGESVFNSYASAHIFFELDLKNAAEKDQNEIMNEEVQHYWKGLYFLMQELPSDELDTSYKTIWKPQENPQGDVSIDSISPELKQDWRIALQADSTLSKVHGPSFKDAIIGAAAALDAVDKAKKQIETEKALAQKAFWALYVLGSVMWIAGNALHLAKESAEATEHPDLG